MEPTPSQIESLKKLMKEMSAADLSILEAVPQTLEQEETVRLVTTPGKQKMTSFWSQNGRVELDEAGRAARGASVIGIQGPYIVSREAREPLEAFLLDLKRDELPNLLNEFRQNIPPMITRGVIAWLEARLPIW